MPGYVLQQLLLGGPQNPQTYAEAARTILLA